MRSPAAAAPAATPRGTGLAAGEAAAGTKAAGQRRRRSGSGGGGARHRRGHGPHHSGDRAWSGGDGAQAQGGAAADGEDAAVQLGGRPGVVDGGDLLAVDADGALADQPPGLAPGAGEPGLGQ
jgi:hypothetical protein